ncbi:MAG: radical SAM protein [Candidatus Omnitrophica bacterium]|nr:radical SAM protein [Candidatus Omnitrophota bacterium]MDD3274908.1 radical SAM protein [Candidatus Omnitrophota bacterium]
MKINNFTSDLKKIFCPDRTVSVSKVKPQPAAEGKKETEWEHIVSSGPLSLCLGKRDIQIFWLGKQVTVGSGLNLGVNILGFWTDSSKACWEVLEKGSDFFMVRIAFSEIPLVQDWKVSVREGGRFSWEIESRNNEWLHIDEFRILHLLNPAYTSWFCGYEQGDFSRFDKNWKDFKFDQSFALAGVRFSVEGKKLPSLTLEDIDKNHKILIQNSSFKERLRIIGVRMILPEDKRDLAPGSRQSCRFKTRIFENDAELDRKIELLRQDELVSIFKKKNIPYTNKNIKVLLANLPWVQHGQTGVRAGSRWPHIKDLSEGNYMPFPFFLAYATALLQKNGVDAQVIDAVAEGLTESGFMEHLLNKDIDYLVAETSVPSFLKDIEILKKISDSGIRIILCGPNSLTYQPSFMGQYPFIDFILQGEYEFTLLNLFKALEDGTDVSRVAGILYRSGKGFLSTPRPLLCDINLLPWPHRESLPMKKYWDLPGNIPYPSVQMLASRGCPFNCSFCLWPQVMYQGNSYRIRNVENVVEEMRYLVDKGFKSIYFDDDTFNIGKDRMLKFCQEVKKKGLEKIPWAIMARADLMDRKTLEELKSSGLAAVKYGVESCVQDLVEGYKKNMDLSKTAEAIKITRDLGIKMHLTFCFGAPGETKESIQKTIDFALRQDPDSVQFSILTPFPGTRLFEELDKAGRILTKDWSMYDGHFNCVFKPEILSAGDLAQAKRRAYHLWQDARRRKRGISGDFERFVKYLKKYGIVFAFNKAFSYLKFIFFKRKRYLNGKA